MKTMNPYWGEVGRSKGGKNNNQDVISEKKNLFSVKGKKYQKMKNKKKTQGKKNIKTSKQNQILPM